MLALTPFIWRSFVLIFMSPIRILRPASFLSLVVLLLTVGCGGQQPAFPPPRVILFITFDTVRADHLGMYGYPRETSPNLDLLAEDGVIFERAIAQWPKTTPSFASMFVGQYPQTSGMTHRAAKRLEARYRTLAEMVQEAGYTTVAVVSNPVLSAQLGWDQGFDEYIATWKTTETQSHHPLEFRKWVNASRVNELALPLLERHREAERLFIWIHYTDPHAPYALPNGEESPFLGDAWDTQNEEVADELSDTRRLGNEMRLGYYVAHYDANIRVADRAVAELMESMAELEMTDDLLTIFTSDHGEGMGEHDYWFRHGGVPYNTNSHVPLAFSYPGVFKKQRRIGRPVELIDLYPTLQEIVGSDSEDSNLEGRSLMPFFVARDPSRELSPNDFEYAFSESGQRKNLRNYYRTVQDGRWKLVFHPAVSRQSREAPTLIELYDLEKDPLETNNLAGDHADAFERLWKELAGWMEGDVVADLSNEAEGHSEETLKALRALGYLE